MVSAPGLPTVAVLLKLEKFTDLLKVAAPWVWCLYISFIFIFQKWFFFFYGWRRNFEAWKIWRQMKKEAKNTVGWGRMNWVFIILIVLDFECLECAALRGENSIKQPKIYIFQRRNWEGISQRILPFSCLPSTIRLDLCVNTGIPKMGRNRSVFKDWSLNRRTQRICFSGPVTAAATSLVLATVCAARSTHCREKEHISSGASPLP